MLSFLWKHNPQRQLQSVFLFFFFFDMVIGGRPALPQQFSAKQYSRKPLNHILLQEHHACVTLYTDLTLRKHHHIAKHVKFNCNELLMSCTGVMP